MTRRGFMAAIVLLFAGFVAPAHKRPRAFKGVMADWSGELMTFTRSFASTSWWNTMIPTSVMVDPDSKAWTTAQAKVCPPPTVGSPQGGWAMPWSEAVAGQTATITDGHTSVKIDIDVHVGQMAGDDAAIVFRDLIRGIEVATFETVLSHKADGTIDLTKPIRCTGYAVFDTASNGLARQVGGPKQNTGHRGIVPSSMALHPTDTPILHRLKVALGQPGDHPGPNFPMYGIESPRNGAIPEGAVIRLRNPVVGNIVQQAAHVFGFIIGDTGAPGKATLKTVQGGVYSAAILHGLDGTTWDQWDVMKRGWR